ncbi:hypothetical protein [Acetobacter indonesiensis]|uniref:hypothetical protein n=1 Tax=Acetobacter indonesiensis TaxID=104101 RepID=UPI0039ED33E7
MTDLVGFFRKYFLYLTVPVCLLLTCAVYYAWNGPTPFRSAEYTLEADPTLRFQIEECRIGKKDFLVSGWLVSESWSAYKSRLVLTAGEGKGEFSIPYRLYERPDIAEKYHLNGTTIYNRYGFTGLIRRKGAIGQNTALHLNLISGHILNRVQYVCHS